MSALLVCVTGSIAAGSVPTVVRHLIERRAATDVYVALSKSARNFVSETNLAVLIRRPCITNVFHEARRGWAVHTDVAAKCNLAVVVPASADLIGKLANGIVDDVVTIMLSVFGGPVVLVPAVHPVAFRKPSLQRNIQRLRDDGFDILGPVEGFSLSEGSRLGVVGAMPDPEVVAAYLERRLHDGTSG